MGFNPLNQVYVFNWEIADLNRSISTSRFNPLNQVYVFNDAEIVEILNNLFSGFNPLNQVYVFNWCINQDREVYHSF